MLDLPDELLERTVVIYGASKAYAMTGWRIGAALAPPHLAKAMAALQSHTTTGANQPAQWAAATAFTDEKVEAEVTSMVAAFRRRRDYLVERFRAEAPGVEFVEPHGAFYFFFRVDGIREKDPVTGTPFCEQLMKQEGVALVPGGAFARRPLGAAELCGIGRGAGEGAGPDPPVHPPPANPPVPPEATPVHMEARVEPLAGESAPHRLALGSRDRHPLGRLQGQPEDRAASPAPSS